jgi:hypothetical protein
MAAAMVIQAQQMLAQNTDPLAAKGLALLASSLTQPGVQITPLAMDTDLPDSPTLTLILVTPTIGITPTVLKPTGTPFATFTPRPKATARPTQSSPYELVSNEKICDSSNQQTLLQIYVYDKNGEGIAGVKVDISKLDGTFSSFYTGFYPEIDPGYADFLMISKESYQIRVGDGGDLVGDLTPPQCKSKSGKSFWGGLELKFKQK